MKTTREQLDLFNEFLRNSGKEVRYFNRFRKSKHNKAFFLWAIERPAKDLIVSAFGWPNDEIDEWYELDKKWQKFLESGKSSPRPEKLSPTPRETRGTGVSEEESNLFREFLKREGAFEDYYFNFGYANGAKTTWDEWAGTVRTKDLILWAFNWGEALKRDDMFWMDLNLGWKKHLENQEIGTYPLVKIGEIKPGMVAIDKVTGERRTILHVSKIFVILTDIILKETVTTVKMFQSEYYLPSFTPYQLTEFLAEKPFERKIRSPKTGEEYKVVSVGRDGVGLEEFMVMIGWEDLVNYEWADTKQPVGKAVYNQLSNN